MQIYGKPVKIPTILKSGDISTAKEDVESQGP